MLRDAGDAAQVDDDIGRAGRWVREEPDLARDLISGAYPRANEGQWPRRAHSRFLHRVRVSKLRAAAGP